MNELMKSCETEELGQELTGFAGATALLGGTSEISVTSLAWGRGQLGPGDELLSLRGRQVDGGSARSQQGAGGWEL